MSRAVCSDSVPPKRVTGAVGMMTLADHDADGSAAGGHLGQSGHPGRQGAGRQVGIKGDALFAIPPGVEVATEVGSSAGWVYGSTRGVGKVEGAGSVALF